ncbi:SAM-dependent methyltransferase [Streptomyces griseoloalbus]|uniref:SAM-dependent methyltransferase n=1 Tax=Streptomyces griseoloalbus TaxID=67303 RepID=UPI00296F39A7
MRDRLDGLWRDEDFADWYPRDGRPASRPPSWPPVCVLQFLLGLSDRAGTAEAVRCRIDFKYAPAVELDDPGFHHSVLADFRERLTEDGRADRLLDLTLVRLKEAGLVITAAAADHERQHTGGRDCCHRRERTTQRTDSTHVLAAVRDDRTRVVRADIRDPEGVRTHPDTLELIDFDRPVAVILSAILHHVNDEEDPAGIVRYWRDHVPSGSHFFVSHFRSGDNPETAEAERVLQQTFGRGRWRTDDEIASLLDGLELLDPGIVPAPLWRPDTAPNPWNTSGAERELSVWERLIVAGLARKA